MSEEDFLSQLNPKQIEAVTYGNGPLLVLAGAGTGKTKVLTSRIAYLIAANYVNPNQILAVTFTNKAAKEIIQRVGKYTENLFSTSWLGTFHSISAKILRLHANIVGLESNFTIIDFDDQLKIIKNLLAEHKIDEKIYPAKAICNIISLWKDKGLVPDKVSMSEIKNQAQIKAKEIYADYQAKLLELNACDFGDLILHTIEIFKNNSDILNIYHEQFRYILVDEYQDTNVAQYLWLRLLAQAHNNICCVGDDDQSIYGWRGAEVENILRFEKDFQNSHIVKLEQNYRSTNHILNVAAAIIDVNKSRHKKRLYTDKKEGNKVEIISCFDDIAEAKVIADKIEILQYQKVSLKEIAILVRASFQTRALEETFINYNVPYRIVGGFKFYERKEIKDLVAYLRLLHNQDDNLALERIINVPKRGIGPSTLSTIISCSRREGLSYFKAIERLIAESAVKGKVKQELESFINSYKEWSNQAISGNYYEVAKVIYEESGYQNMLKSDKTKENQSRQENIREFFIALEDYNNLEEFLEHIALVTERDNQEVDNLVNIMTLHSAKGLEFSHVFLAGLEEGIFPHQKSIDDGGIKALEEERRLAYVGVTRAKENLYISHAANRRMYNRWQNNTPSRFLNDLPDSDIVSANNKGSLKNFEKKKSNKVLIKTSNFSKQDNVIHEKFGEGVILNIIGDVVEVNFKDNGTRFTMSKLLRKA